MSERDIGLGKVTEADKGQVVLRPGDLLRV